VFPPHRIVDPCGNVVLVANLASFGIGRAELLPGHKAFLRCEVAPVLRSNPLAGARLIGLASRSGSDAFNLQLGLQRALNAQAELVKHAPAHQTSVGSQGERFAQRIGVADGREGPQWRSVLVTVVRNRFLPCDVRLLPP
jgi:outer membrane protein OmpA-like peptidoglycan-associated protein